MSVDTSSTFLYILTTNETFLTNLEVKRAKEIPNSSRTEFLEKFSAKHFALSDENSDTEGSFKRGDTVDLPLLRRLLELITCLNFTLGKDEEDKIHSVDTNEKTDS